MGLSRPLAIIGLVLGVFALIAQLYLTFVARLGSGDTVIGTLIYYFTFFTIITNTMLVLAYGSALTAARWLAPFRTPFARGLTAGSIALVCVYYHFYLAPLTNPEGLGYILDICMHYVAPILFVIWWAVTPGHGALRYADIPKMLVLPLVYLAVVMVRGAVVGEYPYPILRANEVGYGQVAVSCLLMLGAFVIAYAIIVAADRWLGRRERSVPAGGVPG